MMLTDDIALARSVKLKKVALNNPLVSEIASALLHLGGSAHRDAVMDHVAISRGAARASDGLRRELSEAFDLHREQAAAERRDSILTLPFGEGSRRWGLTCEAYHFLLNLGVAQQA